jgi:hypothetical protein
MNLITKFVAFGIVTDIGFIRQTERFALLLTDRYSGRKLSGAIAFSELRGISVSLNRRAEFLSGYKVEILNVICVYRACFCTRRTLGTSSLTIPSIALRISSTGCLRVKNTLIYTGLVITFAGLVPNKSRHLIVLLFNNIV